MTDSTPPPPGWDDASWRSFRKQLDAMRQLHHDMAPALATSQELARIISKGSPAPADFVAKALIAAQREWIELPHVLRSIAASVDVTKAANALLGNLENSGFSRWSEILASLSRDRSWYTELYPEEVVDAAVALLATAPLADNADSPAPEEGLDEAVVSQLVEQLTDGAIEDALGAAPTDPVARAAFARRVGRFVQGSVILSLPSVLVFAPAVIAVAHVLWTIYEVSEKARQRIEEQLGGASSGEAEPQHMINEREPSEAEPE